MNDERQENAKIKGHRLFLSFLINFKRKKFMNRIVHDNFQSKTKLHKKFQKLNLATKIADFANIFQWNKTFNSIRMT